MYSTTDLFFKLIDMGFDLKGLLQRVKELKKTEEIIEWKLNNGDQTILKLKKHLDPETLKDLWEISEWE